MIMAYWQKLRHGWVLMMGMGMIIIDASNYQCSQQRGEQRKILRNPCKAKKLNYLPVLQSKDVESLYHRSQEVIGWHGSLLGDV